MMYSVLQMRLFLIKRFGQSSGKLLVISRKSLQELVFGGAAFFPISQSSSSGRFTKEGASH
eukprot:827059-Pyramimonas_sp.AAC.1